MADSQSDSCIELMGLRITIGKHIVTVDAVDSAMRFRSESTFLYAVKTALNMSGVEIDGKRCDLVKRVMSRDGHMVGGDGYPYYLRDRFWAYGIYDAAYEVRDIATEFNTKRSVRLSLVRFTEVPKPRAVT